MPMSVLWLTLLIVLTGCATTGRSDARTGRSDARTGRVDATPVPRAVLPPRRAPHAPAPRPEGVALNGQASWYGRQHHGKPTASGETYDMNKLTAAHRTLPLGSRVLVTNVDNGRTVEVRINDRGPFVADRVLDLSYAAARRLGAIGDGVIPVTLEVLRDASAEGSDGRPPPKP